ncbi:hypothetical protein SAMN05216551_102373 [Chitinasiproducens palmae]|uniref:Uncharacterized protein n=1 Tax=Chitinasiproducens palmae TaxID=1770053 RepID=A0A1H2PL94_9BURK|nr:hypothetical protein SAMN05216551_102373 [Chitinasiproducens palmae]
MADQRGAHLNRRSERSQSACKPFVKVVGIALADSAHRARRAGHDYQRPDAPRAIGVPYAGHMKLVFPGSIGMSYIALIGTHRRD